MKKNWNWIQNDQDSGLQNQEKISKAISNLPATPAAYFGPISNFYQDMDRMFENAFRNLGLPSIFGGNSVKGLMFTPKVDISSTDKEYSIEVEVPGMSEDDIRIDVTRDGQLCICGEKRLENDKQEKDFHRVERSYGSFSRTLSLPEDVDQENIEASFNNGVLTITAPRTESQSSQGRRIEVNSNDASRNKRSLQDNTRPEQNQPSSGGQPKRAA